MVLNWLKKALTAFVHFAPRGWVSSYLPNTKFNYAAHVKGYNSSVVMGPVGFIQRVFPEAPVCVKRIVSPTEDQILTGHGLVRLVKQPNPAYSHVDLWRATVLAYMLEGNAYWIKVRNRYQEPYQLWWAPPHVLKPIAGTADFISHYEYKPISGEDPIALEPRDVVHFRNGLHPENPRLGMAPIHCVLREIYTDDEASNFVASLLRNNGVPGVIVSPAKGSRPPSPDEIGKVKRRIQQARGDLRGEPIVMSGPTEIHQFSWSPGQLELSSVRDVSEERVCSVTGIPAAVAGFGAGLQQTKVGATMRELVQLAWISGIGPVQLGMAATLEFSLLPDFATADDEHVFFDTSQVEAMQESQRDQADRWVKLTGGGIARVAEARRAFRLPVEDADNVYLRQPGMIGIRSYGPPSGDPNA